MTSELKRRELLRAGAAILGGVMLPAAALPVASARAQGGSYEFLVKDIVYRRDGGKERLARLYQPSGTGPFPAVLLVHGGAWNNKDRTDGQNTALDLAEAGIVVLAIDFRNAPEAPLPGLAAGHQLQHPLAQSPCPRIRQQRRTGRRLRHVKRWSSDPPGRHSPRRSTLPRASAQGGAGHGC